MINPFSVKTPESLSFQDIADLYVEVLEDLPEVTAAGHTFINGARGTGKSMMLRSLEPRVQMAANKIKSYSELQFIAIHIPLKKSEFITELNRLSGDSLIYYSEHQLVTSICIHMFKALHDIEADLLDEKKQKAFYEKVLRWLKISGHDFSSDPRLQDSVFGSLQNVFEEINIISKTYLRRLYDKIEYIPYKGVLLSYADFLIPIVSELKKACNLPQVPVFLMLDDADCTPMIVQKIINTWVYCRTTNDIALKISTQHRYSTYITLQGDYIEPPHDYHDIDLTNIYSPESPGKSKFYQRALDIVNTRLKRSGIDINAEAFFPQDIKQEAEIELIAREIKEKWDKGEGLGYRSGDDAYRYARPEYIRRLGGSRKASSKYSYAGFKNITRLASGVIRSVLEPASRMYNKCQREMVSQDLIKKIPVHVQNDVIFNWSEEFLTTDFEKRKKSLLRRVEMCSDDVCCHEAYATQLFRMINSLGMYFQSILLDESASERRVYSFMLSDEPDAELEKILSLAVEWGYLQRKTIGKKEGLGRNLRYVMNKRLAPYFRLDVSGFAGNKSITSHSLKVACSDTNEFLRSKRPDRDTSWLPLLPQEEI